MYLRKPRLEALLLGKRGRRQAGVGRVEEVAGVHVEGRDLGCRTCGTRKRGGKKDGKKKDNKYMFQWIKTCVGMYALYACVSLEY